jgi:hypothetical protein
MEKYTGPTFRITLVREKLQAFQRVSNKDAALPGYNTDHEETRGICTPIDATYFEAQLQQD